MKKVNIGLFFLILILAATSACSPGAQPISPTSKPAQTVQPSATLIVTETPVPLPTNTATLEPTPEPLACTIVFDTDRDANREIYKMAPDGSQVVNLTNQMDANDWAPSWSADGQKIAFVSDRPAENGQGPFIFVMSADGSDQQQASFEDGSDWPDWSPDGSQIVYTAGNDIYITSLTGSGAMNLTNSAEKDTHPHFSPDGRQIAWLAGDDWAWDVFVMNSDGSQVRQITNNHQEADVKWTVDGRLFTGWGWNDREQICQNCVVDANGENIQDAGGKGEVQRYLPFWTENGERVELASGAILTSDEEIYLVGEPFPDFFLNLTNNPAQDSNPDWPANCGPAVKNMPEEEQSESAPTAESTNILLGYAGDDPDQSQRRDNFQQACKELALECLIDDVPALLDKHVSAIIINSDPQRVEQQSEEILSAVNSGTPVFLLDAEIDEPAVYSVTIKHEDWQSIQIDWLIKDMGGQGQMALFDFYADGSDTRKVEEYLKNFQQVQIAANWSGPKQLKDVKPDLSVLFQSNPQIRAVWTNDYYSEIVLGFGDLALPGSQWPALLCDASMEGLYVWKDRLAQYPGMRCLALSNPPGIAYDAAYAAYYLSSGLPLNHQALSGSYGRSLLVEIPAVTNENLQSAIDSLAGKRTSDVYNQLLTPEEIKANWFQP